jgi:hypothetical protein
MVHRIVAEMRPASASYRSAKMKTHPKKRAVTLRRAAWEEMSLSKYEISKKLPTS